MLLQPQVFEQSLFLFWLVLPWKCLLGWAPSSLAPETGFLSRRRRKRSIWCHFKIYKNYFFCKMCGYFNYSLSEESFLEMAFCWTAMAWWFGNLPTPLSSSSSSSESSSSSFCLGRRKEKKRFFVSNLIYYIFLTWHWLFFFSGKFNFVTKTNIIAK